MIRIVGINRSECPDTEFILLQNQAGLRIQLRGHLLLSDHALDGCDLSKSCHVFGEEAMIPAGMYVLLYSGCGESRWVKTKDNALVYYTYMNRLRPIWYHSDGPIHILNRHHTYQERREPALVM